ncbi:MAG: hypothetical protein V4669_12185 [Pseudomonadota bacterium]|jgi:hypothetical protein
MDLNIKKRENKREVINTMKARALDGSERTIEECIAYVRTRTVGGEWSEWAVNPPNQFWSNGIFCNRLSDTEFQPLMTEEKLTLI